MGIRRGPARTDFVPFPKPRPRLKNDAASGVVRHPAYHESLRLRPSRRNRNLPQHDHRDAPDQVTRIEPPFSAELPVRHGRSRGAVLDTENGAAQAHPIAKARCECIRHELVAALEAEQFLGLEIGTPKLFYRRPPNGLQSAA